VKIEIKGKISAFLELGTGFNPEFNAKENIILYGTLLRLSRKEMNEKIYDILEFAGLQKFKNMKLKHFSSGMYLRLAFATAINVNPDILILDEVLAVGDEAFQKKCLYEMKKFKSQGKTIILVTHSLSLVKEFSERAVLLEDGKIISEGDKDFVVEKYRALNTEDSPVNVSDIKEEKFQYNRGGNSKAIFDEIRLLNSEGEEISKTKNMYNIESNSNVIVQSEVKFYMDVENPIFSLVIRNQEGISVYGINFLTKKLKEHSFKEGSRIFINYKVNLALNKGLYSVTLAIASGDGTVFYDWIENALFFNIHTKSSYAGIIDLKSEIMITYQQENSEEQQV
jgi:ABC-type multidrug transport system ATPase subunit